MIFDKTEKWRGGGKLCDLCGGDNSLKLYDFPTGDFWNPASIPISIFQCNFCNLVFLHPVPSSDQLPGGGDWWKQPPEFRRMRWWKRFWQPTRYALFGTPYARLIKATHQVCPEGGDLLDIGCGTGALLEEAKKYYDCFGLEPSPEAAKVSRQKGFSIVESTLEEVTFPKLFDIVTMHSVIEHVMSPTLALNRIHSFLKPGGIVVLQTPKFGGPASKIHGRGWKGFRHGYHTFLFSGHTLAGLMEKTGFDVMSYPKRNRLADDILILWGRKK